MSLCVLYMQHTCAWWAFLCGAVGFPIAKTPTNFDRSSDEACRFEVRTICDWRPLWMPGRQGWRCAGLRTHEAFLVGARLAVEAGHYLPECRQYSLRMREWWGRTWWGVDWHASLYKREAGGEWGDLWEGKGGSVAWGRHHARARNQTLRSVSSTNHEMKSKTYFVPYSVLRPRRNRCLSTVPLRFGRLHPSPTEIRA